MTRVVGAPGATVAVAAPAQAFVLAGVASLSARRPLLVVTPTAAAASGIVHDLGLYLGDDAVELFPAWETLPFERVSPEAETMGRRLSVLHRLSQGQGGVIVAPVKAVLQRLGPWRTAARPMAWRHAGHRMLPFVRGFASPLDREGRELRGRL